MSTKRRVLVVAAHPDDEVLGCGATMAKHSQDGDIVHVLILGEGITSRDNMRSASGRQNDLTALQKAAKRAHAVLGVRSSTFEDVADNRFDSVDLLDLVKRIERHVYTFKPDIVFTHHRGDVNIDHGRTHDAVLAACRPLPGASVRTLLFFEVASSTEAQVPGHASAFQPNWFIPIDKQLKLKLKALAHYQSEMRPWPHPRSYRAVTHLAHWRGAAIGMPAAEAFVLGRRIYGE